MAQERPEWWLANEEDKATLDIPEYEPPRFEDDTYVHEVIPELEREHGCEIKLLGFNVDYRDDWTVRIDGEDRFAIGRRRDDSGNTVYLLTAEDFRQSVEQAL